MYLCLCVCVDLLVLKRGEQPNTISNQFMGGVFVKRPLVTHALFAGNRSYAQRRRSAAVPPLFCADDGVCLVWYLYILVI